MASNNGREVSHFAPDPCLPIKFTDSKGKPHVKPTGPQGQNRAYHRNNLE